MKTLWRGTWFSGSMLLLFACSDAGAVRGSALLFDAGEVEQDAGHQSGAASPDSGTDLLSRDASVSSDAAVDADAAGASSDAGMMAQLDPTAPPGANFDLSQWKITFPDGSEEEEEWLVNGGTEPPAFYTDEATGGMVFRVPNIGGSTSGSRYSRSELREMLRAGDTEISTRGLGRNNWVLSTASSAQQALAGGVDGTLRATLRVDHVSTTGADNRIGRVIVGQIHASENEPCRLYFRKLPGNDRAAIYFAYEPNEGDEQWIEIIGSRDNDASNPLNGIALGEVWSYIIEANGHDLRVTIQREGQADVSRTVNMQDGGLDGDWMYFKAGLYNQNDGGDNGDYGQATFFSLSATHP